MESIEPVAAISENQTGERELFDGASYFVMAANPQDGANSYFLQIPSESVLVVGRNDSTVGQGYPEEAAGQADLGDFTSEFQEEVAITAPEECIIPEVSISSDPPNHNPENLHCCRDCGKAYKSLDKFRQHNQLDHPGPYVCGICSRGFHQTRYLRQHVDCHQWSSFKCETCGKTFSRGATLKRHKRTAHTSLEKCEECGRPREHNHICYKCGKCSAAFRVHANFAAHVCAELAHYTCPCCGERFTRRQGLVDHMLAHENRRKFECLACQKRFNTRAQLKRHERVHFPEQWFSCKLCDNKYATASGFRLHNITKHKRHKSKDLPPRTGVTMSQLRSKVSHRTVTRNKVVQTPENPQVEEGSSPSSLRENPYQRTYRRRGRVQGRAVEEIKDGEEPVTDIMSPIHIDTSSVTSSPVYQLLKCTEDVVLPITRDFQFKDG